MARTKQAPRMNSLTNASYVQQVWAINRASIALEMQTGGIKQPRKLKAGVKACAEIRMYQRSTNLLLPKSTFQRLVKQITVENHKEMKFQTHALLALQVGPIINHGPNYM